MVGSRDPGTLHPAARWRFDAWLAAATEAGIDVLAYCFGRELEEQARLWRENRSSREVKEGFEELMRRGLEPAARALMAVGPQPGSEGPKRTNALPGTSWHQPHAYQGVTGALAWDWVPMVAGKPGWDRLDLYEKGAQIAERFGLTPGLRFTSFQEGPHVQFDEGRRLEKWKLAAGEYA